MRSRATSTPSHSSEKAQIDRLARLARLKKRSPSAAGPSSPDRFTPTTLSPSHKKRASVFASNW